MLRLPAFVSMGYEHLLHKGRDGHEFTTIYTTSKIVQERHRAETSVNGRRESSGFHWLQDTFHGNGRQRRKRDTIWNFYGFRAAIVSLTLRD